MRDVEQMQRRIDDLMHQLTESGQEAKFWKESSEGWQKMYVEERRAFSSIISRIPPDLVDEVLTDWERDHYWKLKGDEAVSRGERKIT